MSFLRSHIEKLGQVDLEKNPEEYSFCLTEEAMASRKKLREIPTDNPNFVNNT